MSMLRHIQVIIEAIVTFQFILVNVIVRSPVKNVFLFPRGGSYLVNPGILLYFRTFEVGKVALMFSVYSCSSNGLLMACLQLMSSVLDFEVFE